MTDLFLAFAADYGLYAIGIVTMLGCVGIPMPASLLLLFGGALAAAGDVSTPLVYATAYCAAILGDNIGFWVGRHIGPALDRRSSLLPSLQHRLQNAQDFIRRRGGLAVFFSRWLVSPLCPVVNLAAGSAGVRWPQFLSYEMAGQVVWVGSYVTLGYLFGSQIEALSGLLGNLALALVGVLLIAFVFVRLLRGKHR